MKHRKASLKLILVGNDRAPNLPIAKIIRDCAFALTFGRFGF